MTRAGETALQLRVLATLAEDLSSAPNTHMTDISPPPALTLVPGIGHTLLVSV